jgi:hypothetical protein
MSDLIACVRITRRRRKSVDLFVKRLACRESLSSLKGKGVEMKSTMKMENRILSALAFACYVFALTVCGVATYALVMLSLTAYSDPGQGFYLRASQF